MERAIRNERLDEKKARQSAEPLSEAVGKDASPRKTMGDGYVPRIDYALRAKLANQPGEFDPLPIDNPVAAALRSSHDFDTGIDIEAEAHFDSRSRNSGACPACGTANSPGAAFCSSCGVPIADSTLLPSGLKQTSGQHHYHHHYHHHYVNGSAGAQSSAVERTATAATAATSTRTPLPGGGLSKAEAAVRKLAQDSGASLQH